MPFYVFFDIIYIYLWCYCLRLLLCRVGALFLRAKSNNILTGEKQIL